MECVSLSLSIFTISCVPLPHPTSSSETVSVYENVGLPRQGTVVRDVGS